jgi:DNA-directed RNA polymerase specialized sigma24 family protein
MLASDRDVLRCLVTYTDWWQLVSASIMKVSGRRRPSSLDGFHPGLIETLDERRELCRRMSLLTERDRNVLFLWYVRQLPVEDIARTLKISRRHCFRCRARAVRALVELGREGDAA